MKMSIQSVFFVLITALVSSPSMAFELNDYSLSSAAKNSRQKEFCQLPGDFCQVDRDCCSGKCDATGMNHCVATRCAPEGKRCYQNSDCCSYECDFRTNRCLGANPTPTPPAPQCLPAWESCEFDRDCCSDRCGHRSQRCEPNRPL
jgi:hypothetical protein